MMMTMQRITMIYRQRRIKARMLLQQVMSQHLKLRMANLLRSKHKKRKRRNLRIVRTKKERKRRNLRLMTTKKLNLWSR